ncbi:MAG: response regulator, partial [Candidatus Omnitrophica bacterium]|nr:response regulator [Candidatus Omnitrophota bacterium]
PDPVKKVLIVDDEPDVMKVVSFRLEKAGYGIVTAANGAIALAMIADAPPDLILLDLRMPVMDGYDVCNKLKGDETLKRIPVIVVTASSGGNIADMMNKTKADEYLIKPFDPDELLKKVRHFIG